MLTTDPLYFRPLQPVITIKNTSGSSTLYTYSSFTGTATGVTTVFPHHCSVSLSQNTHGEFTIQFYDLAKALEAAGVTVGSRVIIECGKQSSAVTRLISGIVRKKGYSRGSDNKVLYTIAGSSTGIRLNELLTYVVSEATKTADGITPDITDATRKADTLLATNLSRLTTDAILSIANLATNSDVETFVADLRIEYGELQDVVNYISNISGGEVVVDTNDLVNFRHEIKNTFFGRGFTIKNKYTGASTDDADDTMYLIRRNWSYEDDFYKSADYANRPSAILQAEARPSVPEDLGVISAAPAATNISSTREVATKFRPTHTHFIPGDIYIALVYWSAASTTLAPGQLILRICRDASGVPQNVGGVVGNIGLNPEVFANPLPITGVTRENIRLANEGYYYNNTLAAIGDFYLDTTKDYWLIVSNSGVTGDERVSWVRNELVTSTTNTVQHTANFSTLTAGGSGWTTISNTYALGVERYRSMSFTMWDPKATQTIQSGLTAGQYIESLIPQPAIQIKSKESMYRHLAGQLYEKARPRTMYNFSTMTAPNIPPVPGDPIVISDSVLGLSTTGNQVLLTTCGDMTYQWGEMERGGYDAPTKLNIQAIGIHPRYK